MKKYKIDYSCICPLEDIFYGSICIETESEHQKVLQKSKYHIQQIYKKKNPLYKCKVKISDNQILEREGKEKFYLLKEKKLPISIFYK